MDKFYLAKITDLMQYGGQSKMELVDVQFSRKPPTFGLMYLTTKVYIESCEGSNDENVNSNSTNNKKPINKATQVVVNLSVMQINKDNFADFKPLKQVDLSNYKDATNKTIVDFDTSKTILLNEEADDQHLSSNQTANNQRHQQSIINCVILTDDGSLYGVDMRLLAHLTSTKLTKKSPTSTPGVIKLTSDYETSCNKRRFSSGSFIQCKFQQSTGESSIFIHVLAEKHYWLYELTPSCNKKLSLISEYSINNNSNIEDRSSLRFTKINTIKTNPHVVLLELSNSSLRIIQQSKCIFSENLNEHFDLKSNLVSNLILSSNKSSNESILLSFAGSKIIAQNLQITTEISSSSIKSIDLSPSKQLEKDPDKLIPKDPSFELDKCWSIDLNNDIENLSSIERDEEENFSSNNPFRIENDKIKYGSLMPMWSTNSLLYSNSEESQSWPEYLIVTYKYHILIYSFEQQTVLPFSVVYDSSFLKLTPLDDKITSTKSTFSEKHLLSNNEPKFVDVKLKPKLLHNFKLIGTHPTDVLFNNILLNNNHLVEINFFPLLNVLISLTDNGDMFAFKLNSSLTGLDLHKDNLFQKKYAEAICGDSLLKDQMKRLQKEIGMLKSNMQRLEEESLSLVGKKNQESNHLSSLIQTELRQSDDTECLYYIFMCLSNLIKVSQVIIMSNVDSHILKPVSTINCQSVHIANDINILDEIEDLNCDKTLSKLKLDLTKLTDNNVLQHKDDNLIKTWAIIDLEKEDPALSRVIKLNLPIFITDKQNGFIKVFFILDDCLQKLPIESLYNPIIRSQLSGNVEHSLFETFNKFNTMFHIEELPIKPLISYKQVAKDEPLFTNSENHLVTLKITGSYKRDSMISWLAECFQDSINFRKSKVKLKSQFNNSSIEYNVLDDSSNQILLSSDDVISLDLIKKHILKRATDESTKLNISQNPSTSSTTVVSNQSQTLESRLKLMSLVRATLPDVQKQQSSEQLESSVDIIIDSLMSEISNVDQGLQIDLNTCFKDEIKLENSLRKDLEILMKDK